MKLITRDTDYALRAICYAAKHKTERVSVSELVGKLSVPRPFLRKLLQRLHKEGILKSYKGQGGGFLLNVPAEKIFITDIMRVFQGPLSLNECFLKKIACPHRKTCALKRKLDGIEKHVIGQLSGISIFSLLKG